MSSGHVEDQVSNLEQNEPKQSEEEDFNEEEDIDMEYDNDLEGLSSIANAEEQDKQRSNPGRGVKIRDSTDPQVCALYSQIGQVLMRYTNGPLPKAINILASKKNIPNWLDLLILTEPDHWSRNALKAITSTFAKDSSDLKLQIYCSEIIVEFIRDFLDNGRKIPKSVWDSIVLASKRPQCFIKGILFPLAEEPSCTVKEAKVISTIVGNIKLPTAHANAFLISLLENQIVTPTRTLFMARFIDKGQTLAFRTIDAIVSYYVAFLGIQEKQPILWYKSLSDFVAKYAKDITEEQREAFVELIKVHPHPQISKQILQLFEQIPPRSEPTPPPEE